MTPSQNTSLENTTLIKTWWQQELVDRFRNWLSEVKNKWIVLAKKNSEIPYTPDKVLVLPYGTRFREKYYARLLKKFKDEIVWRREQNFIHLVLTVYHKDIDLTFRWLKYAWNKLHNYLKKKIGWFEYFCVVEPQKSGFPHLHVLVFTDKYLIHYKKLGELWKKYGIGKIVWIKRYWAKRWNKQPLYYVAKYLSKYIAWKDWSENELLFFALLWYTRTRTYSCSRWFFCPKKEDDKKEKEYEFMGVFFVAELEIWLQTFVRSDKSIDDFLRKIN